MSRRITTFAFAFCAALIAVPAAADRECYDQSCRMPDVIDPPKEEATPVEQPAATTETTGVIDAVPPAIVETPAPAPTRARPQMVVDPAPRYEQQPRYSVDAGPPHRRAQPAPRYVERPVEHGPVKIVNQGPTFSGLSHGPVYVVNQGPTFDGPGVAPVYHSPGVVVLPVHPQVYADPAWKLCQMDRRARGHHAYCGPYSYHPYGAYGYRPYGTYGAQRGDINVVYTAPSARIVHIEAQD